MNTLTIKNDFPSSVECKKSLGSVDDALYAIGGKWKLRIITALSGGSRRFNELQRIVTGISPRVLSHELKELELNGFVTRNEYSKTPVIIDYELTEYSGTLHDVIRSLRDWGAIHKEKIKNGLRAAS